MMIQVELHKCLRQWAVFKGEAPIRMTEGQKRPQSLRVDMMRATLFNVVLSADVQNKVAFEGLQFYRKPDEVRARIHIKQGQLQLLPIAPLTHFSRTASLAAVPLGKHDVSNDGTADEVDFYIHPVPKQSLEGRSTTFKKDALVAAFWWVGHTDVKKDANMEMTTVTKKNVDIPCLIIQLLMHVRHLQMMVRQLLMHVNHLRLLMHVKHLHMMVRANESSVG